MKMWDEQEYGKREESLEEDVEKDADKK